MFRGVAEIQRSLEGIFFRFLFFPLKLKSSIGSPFIEAPPFYFGHGDMMLCNRFRQGLGLRLFGRPTFPLFITALGRYYS